MDMARHCINAHICHQSVVGRFHGLRRQRFAQISAMFLTRVFWGRSYACACELASVQTWPLRWTISDDSYLTRSHPDLGEPGH